MKIAMTGATGRVGSRLLPRLRAEGHDVRTLAHRLARPRPATPTVDPTTVDPTTVDPTTVDPTTVDAAMPAVVT